MANKYWTDKNETYQIVETPPEDNCSEKQNISTTSSLQENWYY